MKSVTWQVALVGLLAAAIAVGAVWRLTGRGGLSAPPPASVEIFGPDRDSVERLEFKHRLSGEVIAGRLSLFEAAAAFRDADAQGQRPAVYVVESFPGAASEEEAYCRSVIAWVGAEAPCDRADDLTSRLRAELDARLPDGAIQLPDPSAR
jgi:hypothetical protein